MPPKLSKSDKQDLIVAHLRASGTCHTLKELEKALPAVASINSIQVKEYVQALVDEGRLRVEKIGSGNWYWIFGSEEKRERERQLARLQMEVEKTRKSCTDAEAAVAAETTRRQDETGPGMEDERRTLRGRKAELETELRRLRGMAQGGDSPSRKGSQQLRNEIAEFRQQALQWTDNCYVLEEYVRKLAGGDREIVTAVLRECYGDEYVDGEGLRELD